MRFATECRPFVLPTALLALLLAVFGRPIGAAASSGLALLLLLFFRIPRRTSPSASDVVVAPANGRVLRVEVVEDRDVGTGRFHRVVTFLSVFDVHVQRAPVDGQVVRSQHSPGRKLPAFRTGAGEVNEQQLTVLRRPDGDLVGVRQIAGLLARRVVSYLETGSSVRRGDLMGLIKFGSRVDLLVPVSYHLQVRVGQRLRDGETAIARPQSEP